MKWLEVYPLTFSRIRSTVRLLETFIKGRSSFSRFENLAMDVLLLREAEMLKASAQPSVWFVLRQKGGQSAETKGKPRKTKENPTWF
eukprot:s4_g60.t1